MWLKSLFGKISVWLDKYFYNIKWRCNVCGKEVFDGEYFCKDCLKNLPYNDKMICQHCGRQVKVDTNYCSTCKNQLTSLALCRSAFNYQPPISALIKGAKYNGKKYLLEIFANYLALTYFKHYFLCEGVVYVPMTEKAEKKRGYNQSKILAELLAEKINLPIIDCLVKKQDTPRQAKLTREERQKNLINAFKVKDKKEIKDKHLLIVDDVTTTGSTAEIIARKLNKAGAKTVSLITVASVPPIDKY